MGRMFFLAVIAMAAFGFLSGRLSDDSMRDPLTLLTFLAWLASIVAVLGLGVPWPAFVRRR